MNELKVFEAESGIHQDNYSATTDENGHIVTLSLHDDEGEWFYCTGDLIQAISRFVFLKELVVEVSNFTITDLSGLAAFPHLEKLELVDCCKVDDISVLAGLKHLTQLSIGNAGINDISPLKDLKGVTVLDLSGSNIENIDILSNYTELVTVNFSYNQLKDVSALKRSKGIKCLHLEHNQISDLSFATEFRALEYLGFTGNQIKDISFLSPLVELKYLYISGNPIIDISSVSGLDKLIYLDMQKIPVNDLTALQELTNLTSLSAGPVKHFDGELISNFTELTFLKLEDCGINNVQFLIPLTKLIHINLDNNAIDDLKPFVEHPRLTYISLKNNRIAEPYPARFIRGWNSLDLTGNAFGNRLYDYKYTRWGGSDEFNADMADYWFNLGDDDKALAYCYVDSINIKALQIYYRKLFATDPANDYLRLYYVMRCSYILINQKVEGEEILKMRNDIVAIVKNSNFFNKAQLLISLEERGRSVSNYNHYSEYNAYLKSNENAAPNPEILYMLGSKTLKSREHLDDCLSIYQQLFRMNHPLYIALSRSIAEILKNYFAYTDRELCERYKAILLHPDAHDIAFFDTTLWFKEHYRNYIHDSVIRETVNSVTTGPIKPKIDHATGRVERTYPEVNVWRIVARILLVAIALLRLAKGCN